MKLLYSIISCCILLCAWTNPLQEYKIVGFAQGTMYQVKYYADDTIISKENIDSILSCIDTSMSLYNPHSLINKFNAKEVTHLRLDAHFESVIRASFLYHKISKGYFDVTVKPLVDLYGLGVYKNRHIPSQRQIDSILAFVGMNHLKLSNGILYKKKEGISVDLNGIAQGYTVDVIAQYLRSKGISHFLVELGGEIYAQGCKPDGSFFKIEVECPSCKESRYILELKDKAITTSGRIRNEHGESMAHHIHPLTGQKVENSIKSVTVISRTAMEADALDNYLIMLDPEEAIAFAEKRKGVEVYLVYKENNTIKELQSSGFNNYIYKNNHKPHDTHEKN